MPMWPSWRLLFRSSHWDVLFERICSFWYLKEHNIFLLRLYGFLTVWREGDYIRSFA